MQGNTTDSFDQDYEPLAAFLQPYFGNIYGEAGYAWTPELRASIREFMLLGIALDPDLDFASNNLPLYLPDELRNVAEDSPALRDAQVTYLLEHNVPWEIARAYHRLMVIEAISLDEIIRNQTGVWTSDDSEEDAALWLESHATHDQLMRLARLADLAKDIPARWPVMGSTEDGALCSYLADVIAASLSPRELADAWGWVGRDEQGSP